MRGTMATSIPPTKTIDWSVADSPQKRGLHGPLLSERAGRPGIGSGKKTCCQEGGIPLVFKKMHRFGARVKLFFTQENAYERTISKQQTDSRRNLNEH
jgi:hypothetical protein